MRMAPHIEQSVFGSKGGGCGGLKGLRAWGNGDGFGACRCGDDGGIDNGKPKSGDGDTKDERASLTGAPSPRCTVVAAVAVSDSCGGSSIDD